MKHNVKKTGVPLCRSEVHGTRVICVDLWHSRDQSQFPNPKVSGGLREAISPANASSIIVSVFSRLKLK